MDYIVGVDAGGTKTEAAAYSLDDKKIAGSISGPGNPAVEFKVAESNIKDAITRCIFFINEQGTQGLCRGIFLGAAGVEVGNNKELLEDSLKEAFQCDVVALHDSELAHAAVFQGADGIITIAGTGSVSYGRYLGKTEKTGGWGHVLGDEGSGYWIGLSALKRMTVEQDLGMQASRLSVRIMAQLGVTDAEGMKEFVHRAGKYDIAKMAEVVAELGQIGDGPASEILDQAGVELAAMTARLYNKLEITGPCLIGVSGGILCNVNQVHKRFCEALERDLGEVIILGKNIPSTKGACFLWKQKLLAPQ
jgi:N-acetylglucosamine kinase-like BadF-type ATPase